RNSGCRPHDIAGLTRREMHMTPKWYIPRRAVLRGVGTAVALPFLEVMMPPLKARAATSNPQRFVGIWGLPRGPVCRFDARQDAMVSPWTPDGEGPVVGPDATGFLNPFFGRGTPMGGGLAGVQFRDVSAKLTLLTGLSAVTTGHSKCAEMLAPGLECPS